MGHQSPENEADDHQHHQAHEHHPGDLAITESCSLWWLAYRNLKGNCFLDLFRHLNRR